MRKRLEVARRLIGDEAVRLVTFVGTGGAGKTALALEAARQTAAERTAGACLVELADTAPGSAIESAVARSLGVVNPCRGSITDAVVRALHGLDIILVLDNCEHVIGSVRGLVSALVRRCPWVTVLATSRTALRIRCEHRLRVDPLAVPDLSRNQTPSALLRVASVTLFVQRWRAVNSGYVLTRADARPVAEICTRLDGLPLAVELAAAGGSQFTPPDLLRRLARPEVLGGDAPIDLPERHRSLEVVLEWSYRLLDDSARTLFRRLAVFVGSFERYCAVDVIGSGTAPDLTGSGLARLVDASLVAPVAGQPNRLRLLETARSYAARLLAESGESQRISRAHARWFTQWAERGADRFENAGQREWLEALDYEFGNIRAALAWSLDSDPALGLRLGAAVQRYWDMRGLPGEGESVLAAFLDLDSHPSAARVNALLELAGFATRREDAAAVERFAGEADLVANQLGDLAGRAKALAALTYAAFMHADPSALGIASRGLEYAEKSGDPAAISHARLALGVATMGAGRLDEALAHFTATSTVARGRGDLWLLSECNDVLAQLQIVRGEFAQARSTTLEGLLARTELRNRPIIPLNLRTIGVADVALDAPERAVVLFGAALAMERSLGALPHTESADHYRGALERSRLVLGDPRFDQLWNSGRHASETEILALAIGGSVDMISPSRASRDLRAAVLTPRELEVAGLIRRGLTTPDIAHRLRISERTVDTHVEHIMVKLGAHSRAQIAGWLSRHATPR